MRLLERPVIIYLIIGFFSTCIAIILFKIGGSLAEITGQEKTILGISYKAGGALAGFILIFIISLRGFERLQKISNAGETGRINMKLYLIGRPENFVRKDTTYVCTCWLFNGETGERKDFHPIHRWEAGYFTIDIRKVGPDDLIAVRIENVQKKVWECDYFHSRALKTEVILLEKS